MVSNTSQKDFSYAWWLRKVDLMRDFLGAFFGLMLGGVRDLHESEIAPFLPKGPHQGNVIDHRQLIDINHILGAATPSSSGEL